MHYLLLSDKRKEGIRKEGRKKERGEILFLRAVILGFSCLLGAIKKLF
jgi:hypothetical protein